MLLAFGTIIGCLIMPLLANKLGRKAALAFFFAVMAASTATAFGYAFYVTHGALGLFIPCLFFVGLGGASFSVYL